MAAYFLCTHLLVWVILLAGVPLDLPVLPYRVWVIRAAFVYFALMWSW